jgi:hypothetical protein
LLLAALSGVAATAAATIGQLSGDKTSARGPLAEYGLGERQRFEVRGRVVERLRAGSYSYLRLKNGDKAERWVATMGAGQPPGAEVRVLIFGEAAKFASPRLSRTFQHLLFGMVSRAERTATTTTGSIKGATK